MQGSIRQRGDSWQLRVYLGRDPLTGQKRWVSKTTKGGKREAQRGLAAMVAAADSTGVAPSSGTVSDLLKRWFENSSPDFSPSTALETANFVLAVDGSERADSFGGQVLWYEHQRPYLQR